MNANLRNPLFLLTWGLPLAGVIASFVSLGLVLHRPDSELPAQYHWEGAQIDRDFERAAHARDLGVSATLKGFETGGTCDVALVLKGATPSTLLLRLTHATESALDRSFELRRTAPGSPLYTAACRAVPAGHWQLELLDEGGDWSVRQTVTSALDGLTVSAGADAQL